MAQRTKAQLAIDITTYIKDNGGSNPAKTKGSEQRILEQNIVDSLLAYEEEATNPEIELETSTVADRFVSPRRFWQGINRFKALVGTFLEKMTFSKGIALGDNALPANGDVWFNNGYFGRQGGVTAPFLTSLNGKVGRVLFVSKDGNDSTAIIGSQSFSYLTWQAAVNASTNGDLIVGYNGTYTENIVLPATTDKRHFVLVNAIIDGTITNNVINSVDYGTITGIGDSRITGAITLAGNGTKFSKIKDLTIQACNPCDLYENVKFQTSISLTLFGEYINCTFNSTATDFIGLYSASSGFKFRGCKVFCNNFTGPVGGIDGGANGNYFFENCAVYCTNFMTSRATNVITFIGTTVKATGNSYFFTNDNLIGGLMKIIATGSFFETACTNLNQVALHTDSVIDVVSNKSASGTYAVNPTVVSSLNLI